MGFILVSKCTEDVTVVKTVKTHANNKPWLTGEVRSLLRIQDAAIRSGEEQRKKRHQRGKKAAWAKADQSLC